jgi:hypothetical protein
VADAVAPLIVLAIVVYLWMVEPIRWFRRRSRGQASRDPGQRTARLPDVWP